MGDAPRRPTSPLPSRRGGIIDAHTRLGWIRLYERVGNAGIVCRRCGISRPTLRKWWRRYQAEGEVVQGAGPRTNISNQTFNALATLAQPGGGGAAAAQVAACTILELDIGAIRLELLGLVIDIAPIAIDITAIPGAGLLGDLLCALAGLLSGINLGNLLNILDLLEELADILGQINDILN